MIDMLKMSSQPSGKSGSSGHACLICYGETSTRVFPLVLMVGREPNDSSPASHACGTYDFRGSPRCAFWNVAYGVVGAAASPPVSVAGLKAEAVGKQASPILFADALPITLRNEVRNKAFARAGVSDDRINDHVDAVFSHDHLIRRVRAVVLSGLGTSFNRSVNRYEMRSAERGIPVYRLPFFYPTNVPQIRGAVNDDLRMHLRDVVGGFREQA